MYIHIQNRSYDDKCKMSLKGILVRRLHKVNHNLSEKQEGPLPFKCKLPTVFKKCLLLRRLKNKLSQIVFKKSPRMKCVLLTCLFCLILKILI